MKIHSKRVLLIPTENKTNIFLSDNGTILNYSNVATNYQTGQYLYKLSDDVIRSGEWYYMHEWGVMECRDEEEAHRCNNHWSIAPICYKIVASNDEAIGLPISLESLKQYCETGEFDMDNLKIGKL